MVVFVVVSFVDAVVVGLVASFCLRPLFLVAALLGDEAAVGAGFPVPVIL